MSNIIPGKELRCALKDIGHELVIRDEDPDKKSIENLASAFFEDVCLEDTAFATELLCDNMFTEEFFSYLSSTLKKIRHSNTEKCRKKSIVSFWEITIPKVVESIVHFHGSNLEELLFDSMDNTNKQYKYGLADRKYAWKITE